MFLTIDLCAGIGGIRRGFELTGGFKNVLSAETDATACAVYRHRYNGDDANNDLTSVDFKQKVTAIDYDVLLAGFPCQAFSRAGKQAGFGDSEKGVIFNHIAEIVKDTRPQCVFLENVDNLVSHDGGKTFRVILETFSRKLNYHVIGANFSCDNIIEPNHFIRNARDFGLPQNRPRTYIIGVDMRRFGAKIGNLSEPLPTKPSEQVSERLRKYRSLDDVLDKKVDGRYFISAGYLSTLEKHAAREKKRGNGFGYRIVNLPENKNPLANTLLATGGSGRERNLVIDETNGRKYAGKTIPPKKTAVNDKYIRFMTPNEWGKLQGFIDYAFDDFSFP
ncbi:cytosine-specific methyltransferase [Planctomycetales bacterium]|nr:cytosine-specific methyltransferase [Planctomycetales bacterium]